MFFKNEWCGWNGRKFVKETLCTFCDIVVILYVSWRCVWAVINMSRSACWCTMSCTAKVVSWTTTSHSVWMWVLCVRVSRLRLVCTTMWRVRARIWMFILWICVGCAPCLFRVTSFDLDWNLCVRCVLWSLHTVTSVLDVVGNRKLTSGSETPDWIYLL